ncbi:hypothetical protein [Streptomyces nitrosporeus]|uniref:hypothetical protein n=1 Tax=Streptomyces nitrosporeus TaxID=28894 RepID=UPI00332ACF79
MTLTRGARITGAVLYAVLGAVVVCWIVRDVLAVDEPLELLRFWAGYADAHPGASPATTQTDAVLFAVLAVAGATVRHSTAAAATMVVTGVVAFVLRLPSVWSAGSSWMDGRYSDELRTRALVSAFVVLAAALALIVTGSAGRGQPADAYEPLPARPAQGAGVVAFLALGTAGAVSVAWEIRRLFVLPDAVYPDWFTGGDAIPVSLTGAPPGWNSVALSAACLVAAWTALFRAVHARPLGLTAGGFLLVSGALAIAQAAHHEVLEHFGELTLEYQLNVATSFLLALAGAAALLALAPRGAADDRQDPGYGGYGYPPEGYGYPPAGPAPGHGYPQPGGTGGFGPPPGAPPAPPPPGPVPPGW